MADSDLQKVVDKEGSQEQAASSQNLIHIKRRTSEFLSSVQAKLSELFPIQVHPDGRPDLPSDPLRGLRCALRNSDPLERVGDVGLSKKARKRKAKSGSAPSSVSGSESMIPKCDICKSTAIEVRSDSKPRTRHRRRAIKLEIKTCQECKHEVKTRRPVSKPVLPKPGPNSESMKPDQQCDKSKSKTERIQSQKSAMATAQNSSTPSSSANIFFNGSNLSSGKQRKKANAAAKKQQDRLRDKFRLSDPSPTQVMGGKSSSLKKSLQNAQLAKLLQSKSSAKQKPLFKLLNQN